MKKPGKGKKAKAVVRGKRTYLSQEDVPACALEDALRVPRAIAENYAARPTTPLNVAAALEMQPLAGQFRALCGAAIAYGLTAGGPQAPEIAVTPLGLRIVRPVKEGDDLLARREALLRPRVVGDFLRKYNGAPLPRPDIARNVLLDMNVPLDRVDRVHELILSGAESVGVIRPIKDKKYVDLSGIPNRDEEETAEGSDDEGEEESVRTVEVAGPTPTAPAPPPLPQPSSAQSRRVFITHGKNRAFIDPIKKLLGFGEMEPMVSVEKTSVSQPVPDKVMSEMRACGAAIIHVEVEESGVLNPNVLIEIGAAMALYKRRFILLVRDGVELPSNLQGLFEVRYRGEMLDADATIRLLEAIKDIKNHPMPDRYSGE